MIFASHNTRETLLALYCTKDRDFLGDRRLLLELLARRDKHKCLNDGSIAPPSNTIH
jgi:hypothetical protein